MILTLKATPKASKTTIKRFKNEILYVAVAAPAEKGEANEALVRFLAKHFKIPPGEIQILSGKAGRIKKIKLPLADEVFKKLLEKAP